MTFYCCSWVHAGSEQGHAVYQGEGKAAVHRAEDGGAVSYSFDPCFLALEALTPHQLFICTSFSYVRRLFERS